MDSMLVIFCALVLLHAGNGEGLKILVHPLPGGLSSRLFNMEKMANILLERGHEVYFLVSEFHKTCTKCKLSPNAKMLYYTDPGPEVVKLEDEAIVRDLMKKPLTEQFDIIVSNQVGYCEHLLKQKNLLQKIKELNIDLMYSDVIGHCANIIRDYIDKPFALYSNWGLDTNPDIAWNRWPSYMVTQVVPGTDMMNFWQRLQNLITFLMLDYAYSSSHAAFQELRERMQMNATLKISESAKGASIVFVNSDFVWQPPRPLMPHIITINGIEIDPPKQLPKHIQDIYDKSGDAGVIFVSFGTLMTLLGKERVTFMIEVFKGLKQQIVWRKFGSDFDNIGDIQGNIHFLEWVPQGDMLANSKTKLFITHAGASSVRETINNGVPVVAIPMFMDQFRNAEFLVDRVKIGVQLDFNVMNKEDLAHAVHEVLNNEQYKKQALLASQRMRTQLVGPKEKFIFYIEQAAQPGALDHLYPHGFMALNWYQYLMLDICAFILAIVLFLVTILVCIVRFIVKRFFRKAKID